MSEWISVDDLHKPETGDQILISILYGLQDVMIQGIYFDGLFYSWNGKDLSNEATHWMELPVSHPNHRR